MRNNGNWIEPAIKVIFTVTAILVVAALVIGSYVGYHFLQRVW
jgi:hypothetical protein